MLRGNSRHEILFELKDPGDRKMKTRTRMSFAAGALALIALLSFGAIPAARAANAPTKTESLDDLYEKAKKEGGKLNLYASLSANSIEVILPAFMKRFPGITVDHTDATGDKLIARIVAEGRGGRVIADTFGGGLTYISQMAEQKLLEPLLIPEAAAYPAQLKTDAWIATDTQYFMIGWNTNLVKKGEEPQGFEDLANPKWKDLLMGEPRDYQLLLGLAKVKYKSDDKAIDLVKRIAIEPGGVSPRPFAAHRVSRCRPAAGLLYLLRASISAAGKEGRADRPAVDRRRR